MGRIGLEGTPNSLVFWLCLRTREERQDTGISTQPGYMVGILLPFSNARSQHLSIIIGTEHSVGAAIRESGIPRKDIFVTTKLPYVCLVTERVSFPKLITSRLYSRWHHPGYVFESIDESLREAGLDYFDLVSHIAF